jgi:hypothetical protein
VPVPGRQSVPANPPIRGVRCSVIRSPHDRYLDYLERFVYFARGGAARLTFDEFREIDAEYQRLVALATRTAPEEEVFRALRSALLKD